MTKFRLFLAVLVLVAFASFASAQKREFASTDTKPPRNRSKQLRIFKQLGLSQEQIQQIRQINRETRPQRRASAIRLRQTKKELDDSIYADEFDKNVVQTKLQSFLDAQAQFIKINRMNEVAIRNILTPQQIVRFRGIRKKFASRANRHGQKRQRRRGNRNRRRRSNN